MRACRWQRRDLKRTDIGRTDMNQTQLKYAKERLQAIKSRRAVELKDKHTVQSISLTAKERLRAFKKGEFSVRSEVKGLNRYDNVSGFLRFKGEREESFNKAAFNKEQAKLEQEYVKVMDELMIGDVGIALELIKKFDK